MSKRFGRNQRRKLQQQLADARHSHTLDRALLSYQRETIKRAEETLERIRQMFGRHFSGLDAVTLPLGTDKVPPFVGVPQLGLRDLAHVMDYNLAKLAHHSLQCSQVRLRIDEMTGMQHIKIATAAGEVAYAFAPNAFCRMSRRDTIQMLAEAMAHHLASNMETRGLL